MQNSKFIKILILEVILVALIAGYFFIDKGKVYRFFAGDTTFYEVGNFCDFNSNCDVNIPDIGTLSFDISPKDVPLMKPLVFKVTSEKALKYETLELEIFATNMHMGNHHFELKKISEKEYEAKGMLPTCIVGDMHWRAEVVINEATQSIGAAYFFKTK